MRNGIQPCHRFGIAKDLPGEPGSVHLTVTVENILTKSLRQFTANFGVEERLVAAAHAYQQTTGWHLEAPKL